MREQNLLLLESNTDLKSQLEHYFDRFDEFKTTLTKSNEVGPRLGALHARCFTACPPTACTHNLRAYARCLKACTPALHAYARCLTA